MSLWINCEEWKAECFVKTLTPHGQKYDAPLGTDDKNPLRRWSTKKPTIPIRPGSWPWDVVTMFWIVAVSTTKEFLGMANLS